MVKYLLIIFLSIFAYPLKSNAWVGVWLGLEAGLAALNIVSDELSDSSFSSSTKKGNPTCVDEQSGHTVYNFTVCPPGYKTFKNTVNNSNNFISNKKNNFITKKSDISYTYCEGNSGKVYKTSSNKCLTGGKRITQDQYLSKSNLIQCKNNNSGEVMEFGSLPCPKNFTYIKNNNSSQKSNYITKKENNSNSSNKNNYITKKSDTTFSFCKGNSGKIYKTSNEKCYPGSTKVTEQDYLSTNSNQDTEFKYVSVDNLRLRNYPGGDLITSLPLNSKLQIQSEKTVNKDNYTWVSVIDDFGNFGWVAENFLSSSKTKSISNSSLLASFDESNYLNIINAIYSDEINLFQYENQNLESLPMCADVEYRDNCYGFVDISSESVDREDGCDFKYEGGFKNNSYNGFATYNFYNCNDKDYDYTYVGFLKDGLRHGLGQDETKFIRHFGIYDENLILGLTEFKDTGAYYFGEYGNETYNGIGEYSFSGGASYKGNFKDGKYDGRGIYTFADGRIESGIFKNGDLEQSLSINSSEFSFNKIKDQYEYLKYDDVIILNDAVESYYVEKNESNSEDDYDVSAIKEDIEKAIDDEAVVYVQQEDPNIDYLLEEKNYLEPESNSPIIKIEEFFYTKSQTVIIEGVVEDESDVFAVVVKDKIVKPGNNGFFSEEINVPLGNSMFYVYAVDQWENKSEAVVKVTRDMDNSLFASQKEILPLDPFKIKTKFNKDDLAIIIGVKDYRDIPDTNFSDNDASYFYDYAQNSLGVHPSNIKSFINSEALIFELFDLDIWLKNKVKQNSRVYLFYSGHGMTVDNKSYILPHDFRSSQIERSAFKKDEFLDIILQYNPDHLFAFFDACFTGQTRQGEILLASAKNINIAIEDTLKNNLTIFNSSDISEFSTDYERANHGLFSYFLMKGMEGEADTNRDKSITTNELFSYVKSNVSQSALELGINQNPSLVSMEDKVLIKW